MKRIIVIGNKTNHGGTVISGSAETNTIGIPWARVGDKVVCPRCKGTFPIITGDFTMMVDGAAVAREGDKTACGASLLSAQQALTYQDHGGTAQKAKKANSLSMADKPERDELLSTESTEPKEYDQHFRVLNEKDGKPLANISYKITMPSGETTEGKTDSDGRTKIVRADSPVISKLEVPYYGHNSSSAHSNNTDCACSH